MEEPKSEWWFDWLEDQGAATPARTVLQYRGKTVFDLESAAEHLMEAGVLYDDYQFHDGIGWFLHDGVIVAVEQDFYEGVN